MKERLLKLLTDFRYLSSMGLGMRSLQRHHIDALINSLVPFFESEIDLEIDRLLKEEVDFNHDQ